MKTKFLFRLMACAALGLFVQYSNAGVINAYPDPALPTFGGYSPIGEVNQSNGSLSITPRHNFATYFSQSFVALPGLAQDLTFNIRGGNGDDGIDFRILIAETSVSEGLYTPTNVVYSSPLFSLGSQVGTFGASVFGPDIEVNLGGLDLVDGAVYAWVLDTVTSADGVEGYGSVGYRHPAQADFFGNSSVLIWDLFLDEPNQPWINVEYIDLAYKLTFSDGGVEHPSLTPISSLPKPLLLVSEPPTDLLLAIAAIGAVLTVGRRRYLSRHMGSLTVSPEIKVCC